MLLGLRETEFYTRYKFLFYSILIEMIQMTNQKKKIPKLIGYLLLIGIEALTQEKFPKVCKWSYDLVTQCCQGTLPPKDNLIFFFFPGLIWKAQLENVLSIGGCVAINE